MIKIYKNIMIRDTKIRLKSDLMRDEKKHTHTPLLKE